MPNEPYHRYQQDPERLWRAAESAGGIPPQPRYRNPRMVGGGVLSWAGLNNLPAGSSSRHRLNTH
ncbi:DNA repair protein [Micromonospora sp. NPDC005215]|uniref:DNA repair protein n=1 Tax=Micromonospora sp. NPDC005215 TaxID=3157024 RepID=UPI0033A6CE41